MSLKNKSFGEITDAIEVLKNNPNHDFTESEVAELLKFETELNEINKQFSKKIQPIFSAISNGFMAFRKWMEIQVKPVFKDIQFLTSQGWYISPYVIDEHDMTLLYRLTREENTTEFEEVIMNNADSLINDTINRCSKLFPNRTVIFSEIQNSYKNNFYYSVINLCYSQADGICNENWGCGFFTKDNKELKLHSRLNTSDRSFSSAFADQLKVAQNEMTIFSYDKKFNDVSLKNKTFNRHMVLHGHSIEYGTKKNAIRAILLLDFLCYFAEIDR